MATQTEQDSADAAFADQFNSADVEKADQTDDEAFGLANGEGQATGDAATGAAVAGDAAAAGAAAAPAAAAPAVDERAKALDDREAALAAREQELNGREAAMKTSNVNEEQTSTAAGGDDQGGKDESAARDPAVALAEDFGPEFVDLLKDFILDVCKGHVSDQLGGLQGQVQSVIEDLQNQRNQAHFKTIAAAHEDFMDITESAEFSAWLDSLPAEKQTDMRQVIEAGSSQDIIDMLTDFKSSKAAASGDTTGGADESALDDAEGVRSVGLRLPTAPKESEDYAAAWNQA